MTHLDQLLLTTHLIFLVPLSHYLRRYVRPFKVIFKHQVLASMKVNRGHSTVTLVVVIFLIRIQDKSVIFKRID